MILLRFRQFQFQAIVKNELFYLKVKKLSFDGRFKIVLLWRTVLSMC